MRKVRNLVLVFISLFFVVGCSMSINNAKDAVEDYLNNYKHLDDDVVDQINEIVEEEDLSKDQQETYKKVLKRQYENMKYEITDEIYNGDSAKVTAKVTVYDYYKVQQEIAEYLKTNRDKFYTDGVYDENLYLDYKLKTMNDYNKTITHTIVFEVVKDNDMWVVSDLSKNDLDKIHGIYDYSNDNAYNNEDIED